MQIWQLNIQEIFRYFINTCLIFGPLIFTYSVWKSRTYLNYKLIKYFIFIWQFINAKFWSFLFVVILKTIYRSQNFGITLIIGRVFQKMYDLANNRIALLEYENGIRLLLFLVIYVIFICLIDALSTKMQAYLIPKFIESVRDYFVRQIFGYSYMYFQQTQSGYLMGQITNISNCSGNILRVILTELIPCHVFALVSICFFIYYNMYFGLLLITWLFVHYSVVLLQVGNFLKGARKNTQLYATLCGDIGDTLNNIFLVKASNSTDFEEKYFSIQNKNDIDSYIFIRQVNANIISIADVVYYLFITVMVIAQLMYQWAHGYIDVAFVVQTNFMTRSITLAVYDFTIRIGDFLFDIEKCNNALNEIRPELRNDFEVRNYSSQLLSNPVGNIEFKNVCFLYKRSSNESREFLTNFNLKIKHGERVALVGPSGSGKSTIIHLLMRFFDPIAGSIMIGKENIKMVSQESLRKNFAFISQRGYIFGRPVFQNIAYGSPKIRDFIRVRMESINKFQDLPAEYQEEIMEAARKAECHDFIMRKQSGYNTICGKDSNFSGGEQQRINIARAFINSEASILILDEATSALDANTEGKVSSRIKSIDNKTIIAVAHKLNTIKDDFRICVIKKGKLVEEGYHEQLMKLQGLYYKLYLNQQG